MSDKTTYSQSLMHMIKGNLGAGILAMPASFAHTGLIGALIGLPALCIISSYCVHALIRSSQHIESKTKTSAQDYSTLGRKSLELGPDWMKSLSGYLSYLIDTALITTQIGVCCVYIVFVVDNIVSILQTYNMVVSKPIVFAAIFPFMIFLSFIRTLKRLSVASAIANLLQVVGLVFIIEYLLRDYDKVNIKERDLFRPFNEMALGFGSIMFSFEGISVVLPIYAGMRKQNQMSNCSGVVNVSFTIILVLYFVMGFFGFMKFGQNAKDSVTLNLPAEPLYDGVRALFTLSIFLSYPLQFYVPNSIIWNWAKANLLKPASIDGGKIPALRNIEVVIPGAKVSEKIPTDLGVNLDKNNTIIEANQNESSIKDSNNSNNDSNKIHPQISEKTKLDSTVIHHQIPTTHQQLEVRSNQSDEGEETDDNEYPLRYEYCSRAALVLFTFTLAYTVPKLNLLMDLIGSFSGALLCLTIPAIVHLATFWHSLKGISAIIIFTFDVILIIFSVVAGAGGSLSSLSHILASFRDK